jgi:hypothetical protein
MGNWLDRFRDDPGEPRWLDRFRDDPVERKPRPRPPARPRDILLFAALMALSLVLGIAATAVAYPRLAAIASPLQILLPDILVTAIVGGFVWLVAGLRRQWAVWVLGLFCAARLLMYLPALPHIATAGLQLLSALYFVAQAAAFWFAFTPESRRWLKRRRG